MNTASRTNAHIPGECWETYGSLALDISMYEHPSRNSAQLRLVSSDKQIVSPVSQKKGRKFVTEARQANRTGMLSLLGMFVIFCLASVLIYGKEGAVNEHFALASVQTEYITINEGDSLWSIASSRPIHGLSTQDEVRWLVEHNDLDTSALIPGQILMVPVAA